MTIVLTGFVAVALLAIVATLLYAGRGSWALATASAGALGVWAWTGTAPMAAISLRLAAMALWPRSAPPMVALSK